MDHRHRPDRWSARGGKERHFVRRGEHRAEGHGSAGAVHNYGRAGVPVWDFRGIGGNVRSLREGGLGEEVGYRSKGVDGRWGVRIVVRHNAVGETQGTKCCGGWV